MEYLPVYTGIWPFLSSFRSGMVFRYTKVVWQHFVIFRSRTSIIRARGKVDNILHSATPRRTHTVCLRCLRIAARKSEGRLVLRRRLVVVRLATLTRSDWLHERPMSSRRWHSGFSLCCPNDAACCPRCHNELPSQASTRAGLVHLLPFVYWLPQPRGCGLML